jgi:hypothetical protein
MKYFFLFFLFLSFELFAQLSFKISYSHANHTDVTNLVIENGGDKGFLANNFRINAGYQIKIPETSMSFFPGLSTRYSSNDFGYVKYRLIGVGVELPFKFFPFNMEGDCNCPDFSLRNKFFEKHFFLQLNSGLFYDFYKSQFNENVQFAIKKSKNLSVFLGAGAGISIPFGKNFILSPALNYIYFFNDHWDLGYLFVASEEIKTNHPEYELELRTIFFIK